MGASYPPLPNPLPARNSCNVYWVGRKWRGGVAAVLLAKRGLAGATSSSSGRFGGGASDLGGAGVGGLRWRLGGALGGALTGIGTLAMWLCISEEEDRRGGGGGNGWRIRWRSRWCRCSRWDSIMLGGKLIVLAGKGRSSVVSRCRLRLSYSAVDSTAACRR